MLKALLAAAVLGAALVKPIEEMSLQELEARLMELAMAISASGGATTPEQDAEMAAIEARISELVTGAMAGTAEVEAEVSGFGDMFTIPETMPLDDQGAAIAAALPTAFRGKACNTDTPDTYQNYGTFFAGKGIEDPPVGVVFFRKCGTDEENNYRFSVDSTEDARSTIANLTSMTEARRREEGIETLTLCGQQAYRSRGFQQTTVILGTAGILNVTEWEGPGRATPARFAVQAAMAEAVDCGAIVRAIQR